MAHTRHAMTYVAECLLDRVGDSRMRLWVADEHGALRLAAHRGAAWEGSPAELPDSWSVAAVPAGGEAPFAVLAACDTPVARLQELLDDAAETLAMPARLHRAAHDKELADGLLEAIGEQTAVLDEDGVIVRANRAWLRTPRAHAAVMERSSEGSHYPSTLFGQESRSARIAARGIQAVLDGTLPSFQSEYDADDRSYSVHAEPLPGGGALVRHVDISFRKHLQRELAHRATHDALTGLPNRLVIMDRLSQALVGAARTNTRIALLFCDVDRFKQINDLQGHVVGDHVLSVVAERLQGSIGQSDLVARFGGDEFVVLLEGIKDVEAARRMAQNLQDVATRPILLEDGPLRLGLTIGVAVHDGSAQAHTSMISRLLAHADSAMYTAKERGRGGIHMVSAA